MENLVAEQDLSESSDNLSDVYNPEVKESESVLNKVFSEFMDKEKLSRLDSQLLQGVFTNSRDDLKIPSMFQKSEKETDRHDKPPD